MFLDWLLASFHHLAVFSLAAILSAEVFLTGGAIDDRTALRARPGIAESDLTGDSRACVVCVA